MNKKTSKIIGLTIGVILFLSIMGGITYAWITYRTGNVILAGSTHCFNINYSKGQDITGNLGSISENDYLTSSTIKLSTAMAFSNVSIELDENCNKVTGLGTIELNVTSLSCEFTSSGSSPNALKYILAEYDPDDYTDLTMNTLKGETFNYLVRGSISSTGKIDIYTQYLSPGEKHNYLVILYIDRDLASSNIIGETVSASVTASAQQFVATPISDFDYVIPESGSITSIPVTLSEDMFDIDSYDDIEYGTTTATLSSPIELQSNEILLTRYKGSSTTVNVPATYTIDGTTYNVVLLAYADADFDNDYLLDYGYGIFKENTMIEEVFLDDSIKIVANNTINSALNLFANCISLKTVHSMPSSITNLYCAFLGCTDLVDAPEIPNSVTTMYMVFDGCTSLVNAPVIPSSVTNLNGSFNGCTSLVNAPIIPSSVTDLNGTFNGCTSLVNAPEIPSSVTNMTRTFRGCTNLSGTVTINSSSVSNGWSSSNANHPFYGTVNNITVDVPEDSTTYTNINSRKPNNITLITH